MPLARQGLAGGEVLTSALRTHAANGANLNSRRGLQGLFCACAQCVSTRKTAVFCKGAAQRTSTKCGTQKVPQTPSLRHPCGSWDKRWLLLYRKELFAGRDEPSACRHGVQPRGWTRIPKHLPVTEELTSSAGGSRAYTHVTVGFNSRHPPRPLRRDRPDRHAWDGGVCVGLRIRTWAARCHDVREPSRRTMPTVIMLALLLIQPGSEPEPGAGYAHYNRITKFDQYFSKYSKRHFGVGFDWRYFKAQAVAESNLRPDATSRAGAVGVMQIMPRTYEEIRNKNPGITGFRRAAAVEHRRRYLVRPAELRGVDGATIAARQDQVHVRVLQCRACQRSPGAAGRGGRRAGWHALVGDRTGPAPCHRPK